MDKKNLLPPFTAWRLEDGGTTTDVTGSFTATPDGYGCSFTVTHESSYIYINITPADDIKGHTLVLKVESFTATDNLGWIRARTYDGTLENYTNYDWYTAGTTFPAEFEIPLPPDCGRLRFYVRHEYASSGIDPPSTLTLTGVSLYDTYTDSLTALNFHKVLKENLPEKVEPGTQHIYFTTDGVTVEQHIANKEGYLIPVGAAQGGGAGGGTESYTNAYTQAWIDERREEIVNITNQGHCFAFAIATDIHVRIEDGDAGRYNQVRDYLMLADQLPIDYICCCGDIMSYCQDWDGVREPRIEKVKNIFHQARCPWWATRGNHDYNSDDNGAASNSNILDFDNASAPRLFINNNIWHRSITSQMPQPVGYQVVFDEEHHQYGYFYVDDFAHKHRMIFTNSEETQETETGAPYVNEAGALDCFVSGVETRHQVLWLVNQAMDMTDRPGWVVSFFSHTVPYTDRGETDMSEFHGYGGDNPALRKIIKAFQEGSRVTVDYGLVDVEAHQWAVLPVDKDFSAQGPVAVVGWFGGHCHADCYKKVDGLNVSISTCTCASQRTKWSLDPTPQKLPPERNSGNLAMSVNVFIVHTDARTVDMIKVGSKRDNADKTSSDLHFTF